MRPATRRPKPHTLTMNTPVPSPEEEKGARAGTGYGLHSNVLGHFDALAQSVATMAPTASAAMTVPLVFASAGNGTWVSYLLATLCTLFVGLCIARFARDSSSPGSLYSYATSSLPPVLGSVAAWALLLAYVAAGASVVGGFVHYANVVLAEFVGRTLPDIPLGIACVLLSAWVAYRDVKASARMMLYIELVSVLVISTVFALLLWQHGLHFDAAQLSLHGVNFSGVRLGLVLAMFSFVGFESATTQASHLLAGAAAFAAGRSELVTEPGAHGIDAGVDLRGEAGIFPLRPHEQAADQVDVDAETGRIAIDQVVGLVLCCVRAHADRYGTGRYRASKGRRIVIVDGDGSVDVGVSKRKSTEHVWQEAPVSVPRARPECRHVRNRDRRRRRDRNSMEHVIG